MDTHQMLTDFKELGPALSAVIVVGVLCYTFIKLFSQVVNKLLDILRELGESIKAVNDNTLRNTQTLSELTKSVEVMHRVLNRMDERHSRKDGII